ncbi:unnamed protein product [Symbiodinium microadriaticum]|nr:unnamed protein product [Symbiodinium microadriaticum]
MENPGAIRGFSWQRPWMWRLKPSRIATAATAWYVESSFVVIVEEAMAQSMAVGLVGAVQAPRRKVSLLGALQSRERRGLRESAVQSFEGQSLASFKAEPRNAVSRRATQKEL